MAIFIFLSAALASQQTPQIHLTVRVTDQIGAVVSGARIKVDPFSAASPDTAITDKNGEAGLDIPVGIHLFLIIHPGFYNWTKTIDLQSASNQSIVAVLKCC